MSVKSPIILSVEKNMLMDTITITPSLNLSTNSPPEMKPASMCKVITPISKIPEALKTVPAIVRKKGILYAPMRTSQENHAPMPKLLTRLKTKLNFSKSSEHVTQKDCVNPFLTSKQLPLTSLTKDLSMSQSLKRRNSIIYQMS